MMKSMERDKEPTQEIDMPPHLSDRDVSVPREGGAETFISSTSVEDSEAQKRVYGDLVASYISLARRSGGAVSTEGSTLNKNNEEVPRLNGRLRDVISGDQETEQGGWMMRLPQSWKRAVAMLSMAGAGFGAMGMAQAQEDVAKHEVPVATQSKEAKPAKQVSEISPQQLESQVKAYIGGLGLFAKMALVNDLKGNAGAIRSVLASGDFGGKEAEQLLWSASPTLYPVVEMYLRGLQKMKSGDEVAYRTAEAKLEALIAKVETSSLSQLKKEFS